MLKQYGFETAEEVYYLAQAVGPELSQLVGIAPVEIQSTLGNQLNLIPQESAQKLEELEMPMGVPIDRGPPRGSMPSFAPVIQSSKSSVNLIDGSMPMIRNQQSRGTCVSFATNAVLEYYFANLGSEIDLSEQFTYWNCKQNDGIPNSSGTWLSVSFPLIERDGTCPEHVWAYQADGCQTEDCGPPPVAAFTSALPYRSLTRSIASNAVDDIKAALEGGNLVAFSVPVFRSWRQNPSVKWEGKINMPLPNDIVEGGHAMCFVGYEESDKPGMGGGRFILRNSWGQDWAPNCPYGAGYGTIPFAYIARHCSEAYTVV
ncbi:MAG: C1 family peptidase [Pseudomonadota bacterium]